MPSEMKYYSGKKKKKYQNKKPKPNQTNKAPKAKQQNKKTTNNPNLTLLDRFGISYR